MKAVALSAAALLLVAGAFSPAIMPLSWHLRHGDVIEYQGKLVPVPQGWYPKVESRHLDISKPPFLIFSVDRPPPAWSVLEPLSDTRPLSVEETYRSFETYYRAYGVSPRNTVTGPLRIGRGESEASCMKQSPIQGAEHTNVSCLLFAGTWRAEFVGRTNEVEKFFQVIRGIRDK